MQPRACDDTDSEEEEEGDAVLPGRARRLVRRLVALPASVAGQWRQVWCALAAASLPFLCPCFAYSYVFINAICTR